MLLEFRLSRTGNRAAKRTVVVFGIVTRHGLTQPYPLKLALHCKLGRLGKSVRKVWEAWAFGEVVFDLLTDRKWQLEEPEKHGVDSPKNDRNASADDECAPIAC